MAQIIDLTGQRFGRLTVIGKSPSATGGFSVWECRCECGTVKTVRGKLLRSGKTTSCGCYRRERQSRARRHELKGKRLGMLQVIKQMGVNSHGNYVWLCRCDCGRFKTISSGQLLSKTRPTTSCGCLIGKSSRERTLKDMTGQRYGRLVGLRRVPSPNSNTARWLFVCDCGNTTEANGTTVRYGDARSCGCLRTEANQALGRRTWRDHMKWEGPGAYEKDPAYAERPSYVYLVRVADYYLKYGIAFDIKARGMGDYQEVLYARQMPRAACWVVEQLALRQTSRWAAANAPTTLKCKGFTEFRENLQDEAAIDVVGKLCHLVERVGWRQLAQQLEAT